MQYKMTMFTVKIRFIPPPTPLSFFIGNTFFWCIFMCFEQIWPSFFLEMNNRRDTIFWNININRVIINPTQDQREPNLGLDLLQNYRTFENYLNWGLCPPAPLLGGGFAPTPPFSNIIFLT